MKNTAEEVYGTFMDLGKAYDKVDLEAMCHVLKVCGMSEKLTDGVQAFYRDANTCVEGERSS